MTVEVTDEQVGQRIIELRERRGLSQGELSGKLRQAGLNWSQGTLSKVETGQRSVRLVECTILAFVLRTDIYALVGANVPLTNNDELKARVLEEVARIDALQDNVWELADQLQRSHSFARTIRERTLEASNAFLAAINTVDDVGQATDEG